MTGQMASSELSRIQGLHAAFGYIVMASADRLPTGPLERNDWNEDGLEAWRWSVVADSTREEFAQQQKHMGYALEIDRHFRFFYRIVALD